MPSADPEAVASVEFISISENAIRPVLQILCIKAECRATHYNLTIYNPILMPLQWGDCVK